MHELLHEYLVITRVIIALVLAVLIVAGVEFVFAAPEVIECGVFIVVVGAVMFVFVVGHSDRSI